MFLDSRPYHRDVELFGEAFLLLNHNVQFWVIIFLVSNAKVLTWCLVSKHKINMAPSSSTSNFLSLTPPPHRLYSHPTFLAVSVDSPTLFLRLGSHAFLLPGVLWVILSSPHFLVYFSLSMSINFLDEARGPFLYNFKMPCITLI